MFVFCRDVFKEMPYQKVRWSMPTSSRADLRETLGFMRTVYEWNQWLEWNFHRKTLLHCLTKIPKSSNGAFIEVWFHWKCNSVLYLNLFRSLETVSFLVTGRGRAPQMAFIRQAFKTVFCIFHRLFFIIFYSLYDKVD